MELRERLKAPIGMLIRGSFDETMAEFKDLIEREKPLKIIAVGDVVTKNMVERGITPDVFILDNKVMRQSIEPISLEASMTIHVKNPAGTVSNEAFNGINKAMVLIGKVRCVKVLVDGEEDLLTLVATSCAPIGSVVVYGQPHEGIVIIKVDEEKKREVQAILDAMEYVP